MIKPYYQDDACTIYHGDCREILPHLEPVDLVLTDPPYGIGADAKMHKTSGLPSGRGLARKGVYLNTNWDVSPPPAWLLHQIIEMSKYQIFWGGNYFGLAATRCILVWDKDNGETKFADCELAWTNFDKPVRKLRWLWNGMLQEQMGDAKEERWHPTQKPLEVMKWAIRQAPEDCLTILDPFMGSGTTLVAARDLGRRCIGIEVERRYCDIAIERLRQRVLPLSTVSTETNIKQEGLYGSSAERGDEAEDFTREPWSQDDCRAEAKTKRDTETAV